MLGEDDELAPAPRVDISACLEQLRKLLPLAVGAGRCGPARRAPRAGRVAISASSSAIVCAAVAWSTSSSSSSSSSSSGRSSIEVLDRPRRAPAKSSAACRPATAAPRLRELAPPASRSSSRFAPPLERPVDRLGRGGEAALEDREREADELPRRPSPFALQPLGAVHLLADVVGDLAVEAAPRGRRARTRRCRPGARGTAACRRT